MTSQSAATLRSRYVEQAASELEENRRRQQELTSRVAMLQQEEALLLDILSLAERYEGLSGTSRLPDQASEPGLEQETKAAHGVSAPSRGVRRSSTSRTVASNGRSKTASGAKGKSRRSLLGSVLMDLLADHDEPRLAKEVRDELLVRHPDRHPTPQVVRNTLESLVAKGRVQRHKQQRTVMYTLAKRPELRVSAPSTDTD
ncbi:hypothetical protein ACIBAC_42215 [Streptomyces sp. NPDC051362]|uniref:hypothetical protein n=1 Tax=Streptomyces sp. NPDC051362 TaxID=3365651 RepID=UPI0037A6A478